MIGTTQTPILFKLKVIGEVSEEGTPPFIASMKPITPKYFIISGFSRDATGIILANCTCNLFDTLSNRYIDTIISDINGYYEFRTAAPMANHFLVEYKVGSPDVFGTSPNNLQGI